MNLKGRRDDVLSEKTSSINFSFKWASYFLYVLRDDMNASQSHQMSLSHKNILLKVFLFASIGDNGNGYFCYTNWTLVVGFKQMSLGYLCC